MLSKLRVQHYKSLFDTEIDLEPLTVFIGPNGSGKSNICESLAILSDFIQSLTDSEEDDYPVYEGFIRALKKQVQIHGISNLNSGMEKKIFCLLK
jgi:AAA15 family ATPase/GTPase